MRATEDNKAKGEAETGGGHRGPGAAVGDEEQETCIVLFVGDCNMRKVEPVIIVVGAGERRAEYRASAKPIRKVIAEAEERM